MTENEIGVLVIGAVAGFGVGCMVGMWLVWHDARQVIDAWKWAIDAWKQAFKEALDSR